MTWNLFNVIQYRLIKIEDGGKQSWFNVAKSTLKNEGISPFYRGLVPNMIGSFIFNFTLGYQIVSKSNSELYSPIDLSYFLLFSCILSHPFLMISLRVQYAPLYKTAIERTAYSNFFSAIKHIVKTERVLGLYRGFIPHYIMKIPFILFPMLLM